MAFSVAPSSSSAFLAIPLGITILGEVFAHVTIFQANYSGSHISSSYMVHAGCVAGVHPSRT